MRLILPITFILASVVLFFWYIQPNYYVVLDLREEERQFDETLARVQQLVEVRERLMTRYNNFAPQDLDRLHKMLPNNIDNIQLILEIDNIASGHGLQVENIAVEEQPENNANSANNAMRGGATNPYDSANLSFTVRTSYTTFLNFLRDLERSLRLVDIANLGVVPGETAFEYHVTLKTYWLIEDE